MNITFLIGNGFDIGLGMKTSFKDFIPIYVNSCENKAEFIKWFADDMSKDMEAWSDFELQVGIYTEKLSPEEKDNFIECIIDFQDEFIKYLCAQEQLMQYDNLRLVSKTMKNGLINFNQSLNESSNRAISKLCKKYNYENWTYNIISFNYTSSIENCVKVFQNNLINGRNGYSNSIGKINHVHGDSKNFPILGVDNSSQILNKNFASDVNFCQQIIKSKINSEIGSMHEEDCKELINGSTIVCIYGMSLGDTDKLWWDYLVEWLKKSDERQLVVFYYVTDFSTTNPHHFMRIKGEIIRKFLINVENKTVFDNLKNRIHIAVNKNIFEMDLIKKQNQLEAASPENIKLLSAV